MGSTIRSSALALAVLAAAPPVRADEPAPTKEQLDAAKKAFEDGNALYKAGKLVEAIPKLKESYKLSRNPFLLYNIGRTYDQLGQKEVALFYFKKFLALGPPNAPMRAEVGKRVDELVKEGVPETDPDAVVAPAPKPSVELGHQPVESAAPNQPVEITATVPKDKNLTVTLNYRGADDTTFTSVPMTWRDTQLVAEIPGDKVRGNYIQYYLEAKDATGAVIARAGKSTSPNLSNIQGGPTRAGLELDDPLKDQRFAPKPKPKTPYEKETLISTGAAGVVIGTTVVMYLLASKYSDELHDDATSCGAPPCTPFDDAYDHRLETLGRRYNTAYHITLALSVASAGVAGYFWYRRMTTKKPQVEEQKRWTFAPVVGDDFAGAATVGHF